MQTPTPKQIEAEIEALRMRIRRLRLERKTAELREAEQKLERIADPTHADARKAVADSE